MRELSGQSFKRQLVVVSLGILAGCTTANDADDAVLEESSGAIVAGQRFSIEEHAALIEQWAGEISQPTYQIVIERDVRIPVSDGSYLVANVFRPSGEGRFPVLMSYGPYGKDAEGWSVPGLEEDGPLMVFETANPEWWVPRGYVQIRIDLRGMYKTPGYTDLWSPRETQDYYEAIAWAAEQSWSSGDLGLIGISYYAINQWNVAGLHPPALKAMIAWEGASDLYRDAARHGGIFSSNFLQGWFQGQIIRGKHRPGGDPGYDVMQDLANLPQELASRTLDSEYYRVRSADFPRIEVPFMSAGNWGGQGLHLRGNIEGFVNSASQNKYLRMHTGTHFHPFHALESRIEQTRFFDHWLKGIDNGVENDPPIKLSIRESYGVHTWRYEDEWPLAGTEWTRMYLSPASPDVTFGDANELASMTFEPTMAAGTITYPATGGARDTDPENIMAEFDLSGDGELQPDEISGIGRIPQNFNLIDGNGNGSLDAVEIGPFRSNFMPYIQVDPHGASFVSAAFEQDMEVTGPLSLTLWVSSDTSDMDIFATLRNIDEAGDDVNYQDISGVTAAPMAKGWLQASHRKLDDSKSFPYRPYHTHDEEQLLEPEEIVRLDVEIWPTSAIIEAGHRLRLDIQSNDGILGGNFLHQIRSYNTGDNHLHFGDGMQPYLLLPVIPANR